MSLGKTMSPKGGVSSRRVIGKRPLDPVSMESDVSRENMLQAWKRVKANEGAPGVDEITVREFLSYAKAHWEGIKASLLNGTYRPDPVKRVEIPKEALEPQLKTAKAAHMSDRLFLRIRMPGTRTVFLW